jgi:MFS family permease
MIDRIGNLIGPLLAGVFAEKASWRVLFYLLCPVVAVCACICAYFLPTTMPKGNFREQAEKIDYWGVGTASVALILLLIPISGGGTYFEWNS